MARNEGWYYTPNKQVCRAVFPPLTPIPVSEPFDRVGVDMLQFPKSKSGNQYAVIFVDHLTKWLDNIRYPGLDCTHHS